MISGTSKLLFEIKRWQVEFQDFVVTVEPSVFEDLTGRPASMDKLVHGFIQLVSLPSPASIEFELLEGTVVPVHEACEVLQNLVQECFPKTNTLWVGQVLGNYIVRTILLEDESKTNVAALPRMAEQEIRFNLYPAELPLEERCKRSLDVAQERAERWLAVQKVHDGTTVQELLPLFVQSTRLHNLLVRERPSTTLGELLYKDLLLGNLPAEEPLVCKSLKRYNPLANETQRFQVLVHDLDRDAGHAVL